MLHVIRISKVFIIKLKLYSTFFFYKRNYIQHFLVKSSYFHILT